MKKFLIPLLFLGIGSTYTAHSQLISGKFPITYKDSRIEIPTNTIFVEPLNSEQIRKAVSEEDPHGLLVALLAETDVSFPEDGTIIKTNDGHSVWRVKIHMPKSLGLGLYFDKYQLPEGVEMYIYNENRKHLKGTYSHLENLEDKMFATDPIQGEVAYLELNIHPSVNIDEIELHINEVASYFRGGLRELYYYADETVDGIVPLDDDDLFFGSSSVCMINAVCPQSAGFENQRKSAVHTLIKTGMGISSCSAAMINIASNDPNVACVKYVLTASHCEGGNFTDGPRFSSQYIFRFNYESATCDNPVTAPNANAITGAKFLSRSDYTEAMSSNAGLIKADFLLMRILTPIPESWGVVLSGYKANLPTINVVAPKKFMGFHHPAGDIKKLTVYRSLTNFSLGAAGTHWQVLAEEGFSAGGSSGSALFDENGRIIGIASVAINGFQTPEECLIADDGSPAPRTSKDLKYSKLSYCWTNPGDDGSSIRMLKPWLDPDDAGVLQTNTVTSSCQPTSTEKQIIPFDAGLNVYPNPSSDGLLEISITIVQPDTYSLEIYDIAGRIVFSKSFEKLSSQILKVDMSHVNNGVYLVKLSNEFGSITQKVIVSK